MLCVQEVSLGCFPRAFLKICWPFLSSPFLPRPRNPLVGKSSAGSSCIRSSNVCKCETSQTRLPLGCLWNYGTFQGLLSAVGHDRLPINWLKSDCYRLLQMLDSNRKKLRLFHRKVLHFSAWTIWAMFPWHLSGCTLQAHWAEVLELRCREFMVTGRAGTGYCQLMVNGG